jgi:hypothetical protein
VSPHSGNPSWILPTPLTSLDLQGLGWQGVDIDKSHS